MVTVTITRNTHLKIFIVVGKVVISEDKEY
jgi:hypothetical protein